MYCTSADCSTSSDASINSVLNHPKRFQHFFQVLIYWSRLWWWFQVCRYLFHCLAYNLRCLLAHLNQVK
jgi:hypothetical protein